VILLAFAYLFVAFLADVKDTWHRFTHQQTYFESFAQNNNTAPTNIKMPPYAAP
jgi:hypothetical protein